MLLRRGIRWTIMFAGSTTIGVVVGLCPLPQYLSLPLGLVLGGLWGSAVFYFIEKSKGKKCQEHN